MADLAPGTQLGGYRVAGVIGRGGMGVVYLAQQVALDRRVALKVINPDLSGDAEFRERFSREAQLAAAIDHRQIIPVYDAGEADGRLFLSMRYVRGLDLGALLQREGTLEPQRALGIAGAVADALDAAHAGGLVHRDVKPGNILIEDGAGPEPNRVFLTDFGLTKRVTSSEGLTRRGIFVGTPAYASPEQCSAEPVDGRTDQYSLACVLHESLTGKTPFPRDSDAQVIAAQLMEPPPPASVLRPGLPPSLDAVLARGMAKDAGARFPTCSDFVAAASGALSTATGTVIAPPPIPGGPGTPPPTRLPGGSGSEPTTPVPGGFGSGSTAPVFTDGGPGGGAPGTVVSHRRDDDGPGRPRRWLLVALVALLVVGAVAAIVVAATGGSKPDAGPTGVTSPGTSGTSVATSDATSGPTTGPTSSGGPTSGPSTSDASGAGVDLTTYVDGVDALLNESAGYRSRLVDAVGDSGSASPQDPAGDVTTVQDVIAERKSAFRRVSRWQVPAEAGLANDLLAASFRDAVADDRNYLVLVEAYLNHDDATAQQVLDELESHRAAATDPDKDAFLRAYNALRARAGFPPLGPDTSF